MPCEIWKLELSPQPYTKPFRSSARQCRSDSARATTETALGKGTGVNFLACSSDASKEITGLPSLPMAKTRLPVLASEASVLQASSAILVRRTYVSCSGVSILDGRLWVIGTTWPMVQLAFDPQPKSFWVFLFLGRLLAVQASACDFEQASSSTDWPRLSSRLSLKLHLYTSSESATSEKASRAAASYARIPDSSKTVFSFCSNSREKRFSCGLTDSRSFSARCCGSKPAKKQSLVTGDYRDSPVESSVQANRFLPRVATLEPLATH